MTPIKNRIDSLRAKIKILINKIYTSQDLMNIKQKEDASFITDIDIGISKLVENEFSDYLKNGYTFYCEENHSELSFPAIILDPIDGTRELVKGYGESSISLAIMETTSKGYGWLYNPFTGFEMQSNSEPISPRSQIKAPLFGLVSRKEYEEGLGYDYDDELVKFIPRGSIAFKLGLLAAGSCDFVISKTPKNIWDIAAGTVLCKQRGLKLYQKGVMVTDLTAKLDGEMIWCHPEHYEIIKNAIHF